MRKSIVLAAIAFVSFSSFAQRDSRRPNPGVRPIRPIRPIVVAPTPAIPSTCTYNLEEKSFFGNSYNVVRTFTFSGVSSCIQAEDACEYERYTRHNSYNLRCVRAAYNPAPAPAPAPQPRISCEYRISTRRGYTPEVFSSTGRGACMEAEAQCERVLKVKRARGQVGRHAYCEQTSRTTRPVMVSAECTASRFRGRAGRPTTQFFTEVAQARTYQTARDLACDAALRKCEIGIIPAMYCAVVD